MQARALTAARTALRSTTAIPTRRALHVGKDLISTESLGREDLSALWNTAKFFQQELQRGKRLDYAAGKNMAACFFEPSTRTCSSFTLAQYKLGGTVIKIDDETSSNKKGETLHDAIKVIENYADVIVLRHPQKGSAKIAAQTAKIPVINAGDGGGEHPTQAIMDCYTMVEHHGTLKGKTVTLVGDLLYGRTVHSMSFVLAHLGCDINYVATDSLQMPEEFVQKLTKAGVKQRKFSQLTKDVLASSDVIYQTRVQKERFANEADYLKVKGHFVISADTLKPCKSSTILMHPLPRVDEITLDTDKDPRAIYFSKQLQNGVYTRMALVAHLLGVAPPSIKHKYFD